MREIKFRAWDEKTKKLYDVVEISWYSQTVVCVVGGKYYSHGTGTVEEDYDFPKFPLGEVELLQYTGLKDKTGKEGYYKDITKDRDGDRYLIEWDDTEGGLYLKGIGLNCLGIATENLSLSAIKTQEVIGDIHTTPKLLEADPDNCLTQQIRKLERRD